MENSVSLTEQDCHLSVVFLLVRLVHLSYCHSSYIYTRPTGIYRYSTNVMILRQIDRQSMWDCILPVEVSALWEFTESMIFLLEHLAKTDCSDICLSKQWHWLACYCETNPLPDLPYVSLYSHSQIFFL